ncbi:MAG: hypothetical protein F6K38_23165 [Moorea sp. SIO3B2]|nr:hypothetical protein [Moorena sp. SIO3B2]
MANLEQGFRRESGVGSREVGRSGGREVGRSGGREVGRSGGRGHSCSLLALGSWLLPIPNSLFRDPLFP